MHRLDKIVIIAPDFPGGLGIAGDVEGGIFRSVARHQPHLDLPGYLQIVAGSQLVGQLEGQQQIQRQEPQHTPDPAAHQESVDKYKQRQRIEHPARRGQLQQKGHKEAAHKVHSPAERMRIAAGLLYIALIKFVDARCVTLNQALNLPQAQTAGVELIKPPDGIVE